MEARLNTMETTIAQTVTEAIQAVSTRIDAIASELKTVPGAVSRMESELNAAKGTIGGLVDDVKALKDDREKMLDAAKSMEAAALLAAPREDSLRAEVAMLAERIEELRTASNGADVLQAVENLRTELRPPRRRSRQVRLAADLAPVAPVGLRRLGGLVAAHANPAPRRRSLRRRPRMWVLPPILERIRWAPRPRSRTRPRIWCAWTRCPPTRRWKLR